MVLHGLESVDKAGTAIGINEVIAAMNCKRHGFGLLGRCHTKGNRQHDGIAVGNDGDFHRFLGIMAVRNIDIIRQGRAG